MMPPDRAARRILLMREAFEEALVEGYEPLVLHMTNNEKDRHVLAAAVVSGSPVIVTANLKDFPTESMREYSIEAQSPDTFLTNLVVFSPDIMAQVIREQAAALQNPKRSVQDVLQGLSTDAPTFVVLMHRDLDLK